MKRQFKFGSNVQRYSIRILVACLLGCALALRAQEGGGTGGTSSGGIPAGGGPEHGHGFRTGGQFNLVINGADIGTILAKTCDLDKNGKVAPAELKDTIAACFKLWDANSDSRLTQNELATAFKELFPTPGPGATRGFRVVNGVTVEVPAGDLPTPEGQLVKHLFAGADADKDGALTLQEVSAFLVGECFSKWDQDGDGSLDAQELNSAFSQLAKPD